MKGENLHKYLNEIVTLKNKSQGLEIYSGLEVDFIPQVTGPKNFSGLDYTIGSIHFVESFNDGTRWEIDGPHHSFLEGLEKIFSGNFKEVAIRYFELTREMVTESTPTIVGHLDKIKIQNIENKFFNETDTWYRHEIDKTLDCIAQAGSIIEVNTRGIYQKKSETTYPSPWVLALIHQKKIPITISSDAHHCDDLINRFPETAIQLKQIGFQEIHVLHQDQWMPFKFDANGIDIE